MNRGERALSYHDRGYNCAQSVLAAFGDVTGLPEKEAMAVAAGFGRGVSGGTELCGALGGAIMAVGLVDFHEDRDPAQEKKRIYDAVSQLEKKFQDKFGALRCNALLSAAPGPDRPCGGIITAAVELVEAYLLEMDQ